MALSNQSFCERKIEVLRSDASHKEALPGGGPELFPSTPDPEWIGSRDVTFQCLLPCSAVISLWARPSLLNQKGQVVYPIVFTYPARIDDMGQIVFGVRDNKIGMRN